MMPTKARRPQKSLAQGVDKPKEAMNEIKFYRSSDKPYGPFSNLYRRSIIFEGVTYPTSEHAYQAGKPRKDKVRDWLMAAPSPALLAMAAHGLYLWDVREDWAKIKFDRMKNILRAKFTQHQDLMELLLSTGENRLVESATVDNAVNRLWGEVNGRGENKLGQMLMEIRADLRCAPKRAEIATQRKKGDATRHMPMKEKNSKRRVAAKGFAEATA